MLESRNNIHAVIIIVIAQVIGEQLSAVIKHSSSGILVFDTVYLSVSHTVANFIHLYFATYF